MARAVITAAMAHPGHAAELAGLLPALAIDMTVGAAPRAALDRFVVALDEIAVQRFLCRPDGAGRATSALTPA